MNKFIPVIIIGILGVAFVSGCAEYGIDQSKLNAQTVNKDGRNIDMDCLNPNKEWKYVYTMSCLAQTDLLSSEKQFTIISCSNSTIDSFDKRLTSICSITHKDWTNETFAEYFPKPQWSDCIFDGYRQMLLDEYVNVTDSHNKSFLMRKRIFEKC